MWVLTKTVLWLDKEEWRGRNTAGTVQPSLSCSVPGSATGKQSTGSSLLTVMEQNFGWVILHLPTPEVSF